MPKPECWNKPSGILKFLLINAVLSFFLVTILLPGSYNDLRTFGLGFFWTFSICITQWTGIQLIHSYINRKISWIETPVKKTLIQVVALLTYSISAFILVQLFNSYLWNGTLPSQSWNSIIQALPLTLLISFVISLLFTAVGFFFAWKKSLLEAEKFKLEMMAYKYESLRNQINPHFLFNSLNVLSDLVYDDQDMAVRFIRQLSDLFRYVLDSRDKEVVPLKDELAFIRSFAFLLKTRYEDKLMIDLDLTAHPDEFIVPVTLQLLVENAVKHNEASEAFPLRISIRKRLDYLEVENSLRLKNAGEDSKKTGLKNIIQQFSFFSDRPIEIIPSDDSFLVRVPILRLLNHEDHHS